MSLQIWLPFTESAIENYGVHQASIINNSVTLSNGGKTTPQYASFKSGNYIKLNNSTTAVDVTNKQLSVAFWFKISEDNATNNVCFFCDRTVTGSGISIFKLGSSFRFDAGEQTTFACAASYPEWTHACFTWDGKEKKVYINGKILGVKKCTVVPIDLASHIMIGASLPNTNLSGNTANHFIGSIDDYRVYDHCLSLKEIQELSRALILHYRLDDSSENNIELDCSGYNQHGTKYNIVNYDNSSRYGSCSYFNNGNSDYIISKSAIAPQDAITMSCWVKCQEVGYNNYHIPLCFNGQQYEISITSSGMLRSGFQIVDNNGVTKRQVANATHTSLFDNKWHMLTVTYNGQTIRRYLDGIEISSSATAAAGKLVGGTGQWRIGNYGSGGYGNKNMYMSDVRIYATALSPEDILSLYKVIFAVDRNGSEYIPQMNEEQINISQISRSGIHKINEVSEIIRLDDDSYWIQLSHHDCQGGLNLFNSNSDFTKFVYKNDKCWAAFHLINEYGLYNNQYEFLAIEQIGTTDNIAVRRWKQNINPLIATYEDVELSSGNASYYNDYDVPYTSSGTMVNGGLYVINSKTYLAIANLTKGNWYGAFGAWTKHGSGIPTFGNSSTAGTLNLYMRIDPEGWLYKEFNNGINMPFTINEN